jgi:DNA-binding response OmpR family regulator
MERPLGGRVILLVEDEPLIALDLERILERAGAQVLQTRVLKEAVRLVERHDLSAAILDHALGDGDSSAICESLKERNIPFVMYSGFSELRGACKDGPRVDKPAHPEVLVQTLAGLLRARPIAN